MFKKNQTPMKKIYSFLNLLAIILIMFLNKTNKLYAANNNWIEVSKTDEGIQYIDRSYINNKDKAMVEIKTKYLKIDPNSSKKMEENIYIMKINCTAKTFKDVSVNGKNNLLAKWEEANGDKLLNDVISESCKDV